MQRAHVLLIAVLAALFLVLAPACVNFEPVQYAPNAETVDDPAEDFARLVLMAKVWKPAKVEVEETFALLSYVGSDIPGGHTSVTIPYEDVHDIRVGHAQGEAVVRVLTEEDEMLYEYVAVDMETAKEFAVAMLALAEASGETEPHSVPAE